MTLANLSILEPEPGRVVGNHTRSARRPATRRGNPSYDCPAVTGRRRALSVVARVFALGCGIAAAILAVYSGVLVYAAATFEHDSLPGPVVLSMVALVVGLGALLCGGLSRLLWKAGKRAVDSAPPIR